MQSETETNEKTDNGEVQQDPLEAAEEASKEAWDDAKEAVEDAKALGHENDGEAETAADDSGDQG